MKEITFSNFEINDNLWVDTKGNTSFLMSIFSVYCFEAWSWIESHNGLKKEEYNENGIKSDATYG